MGCSLTVSIGQRRSETTVSVLMKQQSTYMKGKRSGGGVISRGRRLGSPSGRRSLRRDIRTRGRHLPFRSAGRTNGWFVRTTTWEQHERCAAFGGVKENASGSRKIDMSQVALRARLRR